MVLQHTEVWSYHTEIGRDYILSDIKKDFITHGSLESQNIQSVRLKPYSSACCKDSKTNEVKGIQRPAKIIVPNVSLLF